MKLKIILFFTFCIFSSQIDAQSLIGLRYNPIINHPTPTTYLSAYYPQILAGGLEYKKIIKQQFGYSIGVFHVQQNYDTLVGETDLLNFGTYKDHLPNGGNQYDYNYYYYLNVPVSFYYQPNEYWYIKAGVNNKIAYKRKLIYQNQIVGASIPKERAFEMDGEIGFGYIGRPKRRLYWIIGIFGQKSFQNRYVNGGIEFGVYYQIANK